VLKADRQFIMSAARLGQVGGDPRDSWKPNAHFPATYELERLADPNWRIPFATNIPAAPPAIFSSASAMVP
jgi:hypothetical protein